MRKSEGKRLKGCIRAAIAGVSVANRLFRGQNDLVLLEIDPARLACTVVDENLTGGTELFPHVYGAIPMSAVVGVHRFPCDPNGVFTSLPVAAG